MCPQSGLLVTFEVMAELSLYERFDSAAAHELHVRPQLVTDGCSGTEEEGIDRSGPESELLPDLRRRTPVDRLHDECGALSRQQRSQSVGHPRCRLVFLGERGEQRFVERLLPRAPAESAIAAAAGVAGDRQQPRPLIRRLDAVEQRAVGVEKGRLRDILGLGTTADETVGDREHVAGIAPVETLDRWLLNGLLRGDEHHTSVIGSTARQQSLFGVIRPRGTVRRSSALCGIVKRLTRPPGR